MFGVVPSTLSRLLEKAEAALDIALSRLPEAGIYWPTFEEQREWAFLVQNKDDAVEGRFGFVDGKNYSVQEPSASDIQNAMYNG